MLRAEEPIFPGLPELLAAGIKVVDLSADFRFKDAALYQSHYQAHTAVDLLPEALRRALVEAVLLAEVVGREDRRAAVRAFISVSICLTARSESPGVWNNLSPMATLGA